MKKINIISITIFLIIGLMHCKKSINYNVELKGQWSCESYEKKEAC